MKNLFNTAKLLAALVATTWMSQAADVDNATPVPHSRNRPAVTEEPRQPHRVQMHKSIAELRQKKADGTITSEEQAILDKIEQRGGGAPGGPGLRHAANLTPEEKAARIEKNKALAAELLAKKEAGTITAEEQEKLEWLQQGPRHAPQGGGRPHRQAPHHESAPGQGNALKHSTTPESSDQ